MKNILPKTVSYFFAGLLALGFVFAPEFVQAQLIDPTTDGNIATDTTVFGGSLRAAIQTIINFFLFFLGTIAVAMVVYGGFMYITSQGDDGQTEKGRKIIQYAAIGIIIILISYALVATLLGAGTGDKALT